MAATKLWDESGVSIICAQAKQQYRGMFAWSTTDTSAAIAVPLSIVENVRMFAQGAGATQSTTTEFPVGTISASTKLQLVAMRAGSVSGISFVVGTTVATDAANIWTIGAINKGQAGAGTAVIADIANALNSNNSTGGAAFTANTPRALTLTGVAADMVVAANDVIEVTLTKASSAANLVNPTFLLAQTTTAVYDEQLQWTDAVGSDGKLILNTSSSQKINIARSSLSIVSGRKFFLEVTGIR